MITRLVCIIAVSGQLALFAWDIPSEQQPGSIVDDSIAVTIRGGCGNEISGSCETTGNCASTSTVVYTGDGDWEQKTSTNCGNGTSCISYSKTSQKCDS